MSKPKRLFLSLTLMLICFACSTKQQSNVQGNFYDHIYELINSPVQSDRFTAYQIIPMLVVTEKMETVLNEKVDNSDDPLEKILIGDALYSIRSLPEYKNMVIGNYLEGKNQIRIIKLYGETSHIRNFPAVAHRMMEFSESDGMALKKLFSAVNYVDGWYAEILTEAYVNVLEQNPALFIETVAAEDYGNRRKIYEFIRSGLSDDSIIDRIKSLDVQKKNIADELIDGINQ